MNFFKKIKSLEKTNYGNRFSVERLLVEVPDGRQTEFYMRSGVDYAIVIPVIGDEFVMVEQPRLGLEELSLEFPMGQVAGKENEEIAAIELKEETGYSAGKLEFLGELIPSPGWSEQKALVYVATDLTEGEAEPEPYEFITTKRVRITDLEVMIQSGKMNNMPTIAAFYVYMKRFAEKLR